MTQEFYRIKRLPPYVFERLNRQKLAALDRGIDVIDLGMGNPDLPTPAHIVEKMKSTIGKPKTLGYSTSRGIDGLRKAQAKYYDRRFNVKLDPEKQIVVTLGSKEGFANMAQAITAPGDLVLVPDPTYPIHTFGFIMAQGVIRSIPSDPGASYFHALERAVEHSRPKPIALVVCFPSNPTGVTASLDFYRDVVSFAKKQGLFVLSDVAYAEVYFDVDPPPSILQIPGAFDVAVEFSSMSKTFSMPGWRVGFAVGNERLIAALTRVKSYLDYGAFTPIQVAATAALSGSDECIKSMRDIYRKRRDTLVSSFARAGWDIPSPNATMFAWTHLPKQFSAMGSMQFAELLLERTGIVVSPGVGFGENGDEFVRIAFVQNEERIRQAARSLTGLFSDSAPAMADPQTDFVNRKNSVHS